MTLMVFVKGFFIKKNQQTTKSMLNLPAYTVKLVVSGLSKSRPDQLWLNAGQKYCRMLQMGHSAILLTALSYHLSLRSLFCLF